MPDITLTQALEARKQLQANIAKLLQEFEAATHLVPTSIEMERLTYVRLNERGNTLIGVTVRVEL